MGKAKKLLWSSLGLFVLIVISGIVFVFFSQQTFLPESTRFLMRVAPDEQTRTFFFDDYELRATAKNGYTVPTSCVFLGSSPCASCSDLSPDSYGCPRKSCQIPRRCDVKCRSWRCKYMDYWRDWNNVCNGVKCYSWNGKEVVRHRRGEANINSCETCGTQTEESGGMQISDRNGCTSKYELFYKGRKVYEFVGSLPNNFSLSTDDVKLRDGIVHPELQGLDYNIALSWGGKESRSDGSCVEVSGEITLSPPPDAVVARVKEVPDHLIAGQYANTTLTITNSWRPATGTLYLDYIVPTLVGNATKTESYPITLPVGVSTIDVSIPTKQVTDTVLVRPRLDLSVDISQWTNILTFDRKGEPEIVPLGQIEENWTRIQIVPKPLYIVKPVSGCYGDYVDSITAPGYCVLNTIKELTCYQIGCPSIDIGGKEIVSYECTSAGICAQTIFVEKKCITDASCGRTDLKCDVGSGLCIQTKIFENILQCKENTDCPNPCPGKTASCSSNKCVYNGECEITKLPAEVIERIVEKTLPPEIRIQYEQQKVFTPTPTTPISTEKSASAGVLLAIILFLLLLVIGVIITKGLKQRKQKRGV